MSSENNENNNKNLKFEDNGQFRKKLGHRLKSLRKNSRMTQVQTADGLGMNYRHYQDIEAGKSDLKMSSLIKIAGFFDLQLDQLVDLSGGDSQTDILKTVEAFVCGIGNSLMMPLTLRDMNGIVLTSNKASLALGGFDLADVRGKHATDFVAENLKAYYNEVIAQEQKGVFKPVVFRFLTKAGLQTEVNYFPIPIVGKNGVPVAVIAVLSPGGFNFEEPPV